ncbi:hypothetical protein N7517_002900 [Penicillium concentricum]|uniref:Uncharacterized protein n=1 Tax=Penicillium concentricum TaxID=293559 RepID=A0A9W9SWC7_9EURO|nr:uncharacterized protein N7517_002900 [Penicillium concentricum]KAJ5384989.1 hypothetical protein N7517_002900 [Penicillium concentricum]
MMFDQLMPGIIFAGLSSIGLWHSIPLTGVTPSNSFFWRSLSSLEIAYSIHELRKVHPLVFPHDDATSEYDLLLQLSLDAQQYENAKLALEQSAEAASLQINIPGVTASMFDPSATAMPNSVNLNDGSATKLRYEELQQSNPDQNSTLYFTIVTTLVLVTLALQIMGFVTASNIKYDIDYLRFNCFGRMKGVQEQFGILMLEIRQFRRENEQVRPVFVHLAQSIQNASDDLQHCLLHLVGTMENKYTSGMIDLDSKLEKVSEEHQGLMRNTESFPHIPRQLAWLNILLAKTMYPETDIPDELRVDQPSFDLNPSPTETVGLA